MNKWSIFLFLFVSICAHKAYCLDGRCPSNDELQQYNQYLLHKTYFSAEKFSMAYNPDKLTLKDRGYNSEITVLQQQPLSTLKITMHDGNPRNSNIAPFKDPKRNTIEYTLSHSFQNQCYYLVTIYIHFLRAAQNGNGNISTYGGTISLPVKLSFFNQSV